MGMVAYYMDVDAAQLALLKTTPALVWNIHSDPRFARASMIDVDRDWETLSWLASSNKRIEQCHQAAWNKAYKGGGEKASPGMFKKLVAQAVRALHCPAEPLKRDPLLDAIEGRGTPAQREPALDYGLGAARVFRPEEVKLVAVSFSRLGSAGLRRNFNRGEMARFDVGGMDWKMETDQVLDEFLVPSFKKLADFYQRAAQQNRYVLVILQ